MGINYSPKIVTDGLVLCLDAANPLSYTSGDSVWKDLSGNNRNANPAINFISANGGMIRKNVATNHMNISNNDGLGDNFTSFCIDFTILPRQRTTGDQIGYIIHRSNSYIVGTSVYAIYTQGSNLVFTINGLSYARNISNRLNILTNYCYNWNGTSVSIYINSVLYDSFNFSSFTNSRTGTSLGLGGTSNSPGYRYGDCDYANLKIYNRSLSANEVQQNYLATKGRFGL
jgi:hypothetical protein